MTDVTVQQGRREPFKQLPDGVIDDDSLSPQAKVGYWYLKRIAGFSDQQATVTIGKIAEKMGYAGTSKRSARERLDELVQAGWIDIHYRKTADGKENLPSVFVVHATPDPPGGVGAGGNRGVGAAQHRGRGPAAPRSVLGGTGDLEGSFLEGSSLDKPSPSTPDGVATEDRDLFGASPTAKDAQGVGSVVQAWFDGYATTGVKPPGHRGPQVGAEAKRLLKAGNSIAELIAAARAAGEQGWWSIERQLTAAARRNGTRPASDTRTNGYRKHFNHLTDDDYAIPEGYRGSINR